MLVAAVIYMGAMSLMPRVIVLVLRWTRVPMRLAVPVMVARMARIPCMQLMLLFFFFGGGSFFLHRSAGSVQITLKA